MWLLDDSYPYDQQGKLPLQVLAYETNTYAVTVDVKFQRTIQHYAAWQIETYETL